MRTVVLVLGLALLGCGDEEETVGQSAVEDAPDVADVSGTPDTSVPPLSDEGPAVEDVPDVPPPPEDPGPAEPDEGPADTASTDVEEVSGPETAEDVGEPDAGPPPGTIAELCFLDKQGESELPGPVYDPFEPIAGSHCYGTNHQDITGVEKVVFLGDSVTVGTPNTEALLALENGHFYRNKLAEWLAEHYDLDKGDDWSWGAWKTYDYITGKGTALESGDFRNCSKWGARNDDLLEGGGQVGECFPGGGSEFVTLVVFTMGGNDISSLAQSGGEATPEQVEGGYTKEWGKAQAAAAYLDDAIKYLKDPANFPNGVYIVYANPFEFTDGTGKTSACKPQLQIGEWDLAQSDLNLGELVGFNEWAKPDIQAEIVIWLLEEYMRIATEHQVDMIWMLEHFCGHGYVATGPDADPENRCYIGPDAELWFDITCFHPSKAGHNAIFEMFKATIAE